MSDHNNYRSGPGAALGYPFVDRASAELAACLVDLQVTTNTAQTPQLALASLRKGSRSLQLVSLPDNNPWFVSDTDPEVIEVGEYEHWQWRTDDAVVHATVLVSEADFNGPPAHLVRRCIRYDGSKLRQIVVETTAGDVLYDEGDVRFRGGLNTALTADRSLLDVSVLSGNGDGRFQDCSDSSDAVREIGGASPSDTGNVQLSGDGCVRVQPELSRTGSDRYRVEFGRFHLHDDCEPCCNCEEKADPWRVLKKMQDRLIELVKRYHDLRDHYNTFVNGIRDGNNCQHRPLLNVDVVADIEGSLGLFIALCNGTPERLENVTLRVTALNVAEMIPQFWDQIGPEFFENRKGIIEIADDSKRFYSLHDAIREDAFHLQLRVPCQRGYAYTKGGREHLKFPGGVKVTEIEFNYFSYEIKSVDSTRQITIQADGGLEIDFHCLEPGDTRYFQSGINFSGVPEPRSDFQVPPPPNHRDVAFIVFSPSHPEINVVAKTGNGVPAECTEPPSDGGEE